MIYMNKITGDLFLYTSESHISFHFTMLLGEYKYKIVTQFEYDNYEFIGWL